MNLMLHSINNPEIRYMDSLSEQNQIADKFTVCLSNPPFKGHTDIENISKNLVTVANTGRAELLFLSLFLRIMKNGGRCACIIPDGVLFGSSAAHKSIRRNLIDHHRLQAVISMPSGVFLPYANVSTAILIFTKTGIGGTDNVWFYDMKADGFSLNRKRSAIAENDIPDILHRFHNLEQEKTRKRSEQSFIVSADEIREKDYNLSFNIYRLPEYTPEEYPSTAEMFNKLNALEEEISKELEELQNLAIK